MNHQFVFAEPRKLDLINGCIPVFCGPRNELGRIRKLRSNDVNRTLDPNCDHRLASGRHRHSRNNIYVQQTFFEQNITNSVVIFCPAEFEGVSNTVVLRICRPEGDRSLRLTPGATARLVFVPFFARKNVNAATIGVLEFRRREVHLASRRFEQRTLRNWSHHEKRPDTIRTHPVEKRTVAGNVLVLNYALRVGDVLVPALAGVERQRQEYVS